MTNITETAEWSPTVMLLDITTPVLGGPDGPSNTPLKQLANRTAYLKGEVEKRALLIHSHGIGDVSGLQAILDGKAAAAHTHAQGDITGLAAALAGKSDTSHAHAIAGVTGLQAALDGKSATSHTHTPASLGAAAAAHGHSVSDITNLQALLDGKATSAHAHIIGNITGLDTALASKAPLSHTHGAGDLTALPIEISGATRGVIGAGQEFVTYSVARPIKIPSGLAGSVVRTRLHGTVVRRVTVYVQKADNLNYVTLGEWEFEINQWQPTPIFVRSGDYVCAVGDIVVISVSCPSGNDPYATGISVTLNASLV